MRRGILEIKFCTSIANVLLNSFLILSSIVPLSSLVCIQVFFLKCPKHAPLGLGRDFVVATPPFISYPWNATTELLPVIDGMGHCHP